MSADVLIVVPTLGRRPEFLSSCLDSIVHQDVAVDIVIVGPVDNDVVTQAAQRVDATLIDDPGSLAAAVNLGVAQGISEHRFVNWLGDDDLLTPGSLEATVSALDKNPKAVVAFGSCTYIDDDGRRLWVSKAGPLAPRILPWGPDLIPQPGMLVRADAWRSVGGLDESLAFAFDLDLLLKLKRLGPLVSVDSVVSCFRWHANSLTVSDRTRSLDESQEVKRRYLDDTSRRWKWVWEKPVRAATRIAAWRVNRTAQRVSASKTSG